MFAPSFTTAALLLALALPGAASAQMHLAVGAGALEPWDGDTGYSVLGQVLGSSFGDHLRLGVEVEYRDYEVEILGLDDVQLQSYGLRGVAQLVLFPDSISPYVGVAYGFQLIEVDDERIDRAFASAGVDVDPLGVGTGGLGFVGVQVPVGPLLLFAEGRASIATEIGDDFDDLLKDDQLSGVSGLAGLRLRF